MNLKIQSKFGSLFSNKKSLDPDFKASPAFSEYDRFGIVWIQNLCKKEKGERAYIVHTVEEFNAKVRKNKDEMSHMVK